MADGNISGQAKTSEKRKISGKFMLAYYFDEEMPIEVSISASNGLTEVKPK